MENANQCQPADRVEKVFEFHEIRQEFDPSMYDCNSAFFKKVRCGNNDIRVS